mgnify:CR=1 FL=1
MRYNIKENIIIMSETIYADFELDSNDMFVVTPEGNKFTFPHTSYNESHEPEYIIDPTSHKEYRVVFDE